MVDCSEKLRKLREARKLTQAQVADRVGVSKTMISAYETASKAPSIQHHNVDAFILCEHPPLLQNFRVIAPQTINALDIEQIVFFHFPQQFFILRAVEILAGLLVHVNILFTNPDFPQGNHLTILILFFGRNADVSVSCRFDITSHPSAFATRCHTPARPPTLPPRYSGASRA